MSAEIVTCFLPLSADLLYRYIFLDYTRGSTLILRMSSASVFAVADVHRLLEGAVMSNSVEATVVEDVETVIEENWAKSRGEGGICFSLLLGPQVCTICVFWACFGYVHTVDTPEMSSLLPC